VYSRVIFLITIALVCVSVVGTVILVSRFTREEYQAPTVPPPLPEIPKEEVKEIAFQYTPEVYRDPFKVPIKIATEKPKEEAPPVKVVQTLPSSTPKPAPVTIEQPQPSIKETKPQEVKAPKEVQPEIRKTEVREKISEEPLPNIRVTGIIYDSNPFAIIEFEAHSGIFEIGDKLSKDLMVKKIYKDSVDLDWKGRIYNIKLGG